MIVLTLNSGSSSLKFGLYRVEAAELGTLMTGDLAGCELHAKDSYGTVLPGSPISVDTPDAKIETFDRTTRTWHAADGHTLPLDIPAGDAVMLRW